MSLGKIHDVPPASPARVAAVTGAARLAGVVALAHAVNDMYTSFLAPLLPRIMGKLGLSIALAATLTTALSLAASLLQPVMGYLSDRYGRRWLLAGGPLLSAVFLSLIGVASSYGVLVLFLLLGGLGSAVFHPPGAALAARVEQGRGSGIRMSVFSLGGSVGWAVGPLVAVALVGTLGLEGLWVAMTPGVLIALLLTWAVRAPDSGPPQGSGAPPGPRLILSRLRGPLGLLFTISVMGAFVQRVFITMDPIIVARAGRAEAAGAVTLTIYLASQGVGTLVGGFLADRMDRSRLLAGLSALSLPAHLLAVGLPPATRAAYLAAGTAGFFGMAMVPAIVVKAQEVLPHGTAVSSGIVMGLAWALGSLGVLVTGGVGDWLGPRTAAMLSMPALLAATLLALHPTLRDAGGPLFRKRTPRRAGCAARENTRP